MNSLPEVWLRGPLPTVPELLQPVAHALLEAEEEIIEMMKDFDALKLWIQPDGLASVGFHLQHIVGVQDRLFTYAKGEILNDDQLTFLQKESLQDDDLTIEKLLKTLHQQTEKSIQQLKETDENTLTEIRYVGRKKVPSTLIGLLFHTAEHTMRHTGQLFVTIKFLQSLKP